MPFRKIKQNFPGGQANRNKYYSILNLIVFIRRTVELFTQRLKKPYLYFLVCKSKGRYVERTAVETGEIKGRLYLKKKTLFRLRNM